ncbi:pumilio homolog 12-like [Syzygium oleosum]|uniref:pumilio homolog 12-like n=1 Tax=Syzygium oleosum TaxID=219896 RepID=UPI0011D229A3|nr:pumilio homolog 12-like [Syzygium oleosum]
MSLPVESRDTRVFPPRQTPAAPSRSDLARDRPPAEPFWPRTLDAALARLSLLPPPHDHGARAYPGRAEVDCGGGGGGAGEVCPAALEDGGELSGLSGRNFGVWSPEFRHPGEQRRRRLLGSCPDGRGISGAEAEALRPALNTFGQVCLYRDGSSDCYTDRISQVSQNTNLSQQNGLLSDYARLCLGVIDNGSRSNGLVPGSSLNDRRAQFAQAALNCTSVEAMRGRIESIATDPEGFRVLLSMMERMDRDETELVFSETIGRVGYLMTDPFANHVVQRLVEVCSEEQRMQILYAVTWNSQIVSICLSTYGIRSIQKLMDTLTTRWQKNVVIHALAPFMYQLIKNAVGHHVIRHCLKVFSNEDNEILYDLVATKCYEIATDKSGCCILQQCVEHAQGKQRDRLVAEITAHALLLAENRYGNYVVQHLLTLEIPQVADDLHRQFLGNYAVLSCNKYGSNVVEKCLKEMGYNQFKQIVVELLEEFLTVLLNEFGNYVIRRAVEVSKEQRQTQIYYILSAELKRYDPLIKSNPYGKKAVSRLEKQNILP